MPHSAIEALHPLADLDKGTLHLEVATRTRPEPMMVRASVSDGGTVVASAELAVNAGIRGDVKDNLTWYKATAVADQAVLDLAIPGAKAWTPDNPFLYDLVVELRDQDGALLDRVQSYAAMRTIAVGHLGQNTVPLLNGKPIFFQGALEQGFWPDGLYAAPSDAALRFDVEAAKKLGLNAVRKHIKIEPERYYSWCDRLGLMVIQDFPSGRDGDSFDRPADHARGRQRMRDGAPHPPPAALEPSRDRLLGDVQRGLGPARHPAPGALGQGARSQPADR